MKTTTYGGMRKRCGKTMGYGGVHGGFTLGCGCGREYEPTQTHTRMNDCYSPWYFTLIPV